MVCVAWGCGTERGAQTGEGCKRNADCGKLVCKGAEALNLEDLEPLPLECGAERSGRPAALSCEKSSDCERGICALAGACVEPCGYDDDCSSTGRCQLIYARGEGEQLHPLSACVEPVFLPSRSRHDSEIRHGAFSGGVDSLGLAGSTDTTLFVVEHLDDDSWPVPAEDTSCRPPLCARTLKPFGSNAARWFDRNALEDPDGPINPVALGDHVYPLTVLVPSGPRAMPQATGYDLEVETKRAGDARITTITGKAGGGKLDLNVFYVGAEEFEDASDALPDTLAGALEVVDRIFEPAGVFIGDVRQIQVRGELLERGADLPNAEVSRGFAEIVRQYGVFPQLPELFKLSAGAANIAIDVFLIRDFDAQGDVDLGGITGATPLPWGMHGTAASGIAIAADPLAGDPERLGRTLAHELGHAFGLFHTTEVNGEVFDPLPDTPVCPKERLEADDCAELGADNLMFPTTSANAATLTDDQITVIRRALILQ